MFVFGLAVRLWSIRVAVVNRIVVTVHPVRMYLLDHPYTAHQPTFCSTVLLTDQLDLLGISFVLHAIINNQVGLLAVIEQWLYKLPQLSSRALGLCKIVTNCVMAHSFQVLRQVCTGVIGWRTDKIFDVLAFRYHACTLS